MNSKTCTKCGETKGLGEFYKRQNGSIDGYEHSCKTCKRNRQRIRRGVKKPQVDDDGNRLYAAKNGHRKCTQCQQSKTLDEFAIRKDGINEGLTAECKQCLSERSRAYRENNAEKVRNMERERYIRRKRKDPDEFRLKAKIRARKYRKNNPHKTREHSRKYRENNPHKAKASTLKYRRNNLEKERARDRDAKRRERKLNPSGVREREAVVKSRRRARKRNATIGAVPTRSDLLAQQGGMCASCKSKDGPFHLDHVMPLALGGSHTKDNAQMLCARCNLSKGAKHPLEWAAENGRLF